MADLRAEIELEQAERQADLGCAVIWAAGFIVLLLTCLTGAFVLAVIFNLLGIG